MARAVTFLRLSNDQRRLLLRALGAVLYNRARLVTRPFKELVPEGEALAGGERQDENRARAIGWAVERAGRFVPGATCLVQGLAAMDLLRRDALERRLVVGVARDAGGRLEAHAWVRSGELTVVGGRDLARFQALPER